jgi:hypothetical protein
MLYFLIEGGTMFAARNRDRHDFGSFRQVANFFETLVEGFSLSIDSEVITADIHPVCVPDQTQRLVKIFDDLSGSDLLASIVEDDLHGSEFEIVKDVDHFWDRDIGETTCRRSDIHR